MVDNSDMVTDSGSNENGDGSVAEKVNHGEEENGGEANSRVTDVSIQEEDSNGEIEKIEERIRNKGDGEEEFSTLPNGAIGEDMSEPQREQSENGENGGSESSEKDSSGEEDDQENDNEDGDDKSDVSDKNSAVGSGDDEEKEGGSSTLPNGVGREDMSEPQHKQSDDDSELAEKELPTEETIKENDSNSEDEGKKDENGDDSSTDGSDGGGKEKVPTDEYGRELSAYEVMRLQRIQRNKAYLAQLGLEEEKNNVKESYEKENQQKKKKKKQAAEELVERRQSMARKSKTRDVDYSGDLLKMISQPKPKKQESRNRKKAEKVKSRDEQVPRFIYLEFERIKRNKNKNVATAKRLIKLSELECRVAKRNLEVHERREKRKQEKEEKRIALERKMKYAPILNELDSRRSDLHRARKEFEAWQHEASSSSKQLEENYKSVFIDSKIGFPEGLKKNENLLNLMLHERLKLCEKDSNASEIPSSARKKRKRKRPDEEPSEIMKSVDDPKPVESLNDDDTTDLTKKASNTDDASTGAKKSNQLTKARNVGGPVTPSLASSVQRKWLERDTPVPADVSTHFVPQAGDIVLYVFL